MNEPKSEWIIELEAACEATSQAQVARRLGIADGTVSQLLSGKYGAATNNMQQRIEGALMGRTVVCPVIGELRRDVCLDYQGRKAAATNPLRVQLATACRTCANRRAK